MTLKISLTFEINKVVGVEKGGLVRKEREDSKMMKKMLGIVTMIVLVTLGAVAADVAVGCDPLSAPGC